MVAIKLLVASLASLAVAQPIEPRSPDLGSDLSQRIDDLIDGLGLPIAGELVDVLKSTLTKLGDTIGFILSDGSADNGAEYLQNTINEIINEAIRAAQS